MGLIYRFLLVFAFLSATALYQTAFATHVAGADITYENVGQDSFLVTLNVYRDCGGNPLNTTNIDLDFVSDCGQTFVLNNMTLTNGPTGTEVSQLCPSALANSTCNGGVNPGVQHYIFQEIVVLNPQCDGWNMSWTFSARNSATNLVGQDDMHVYASINSATDPTNSSPTFNNTPIPYVCLNSLVNYNFGVVEPDGDSLFFELVNPLISANNSVVWQPGYTALTAINGISINSATGQLSFLPTTQGNFVVAVKVCDYDRATGNLLGCIVRDVQLIVQNCFNLPPTSNGGGMTNASSNAINSGNDSLTICEGELLTFDIVYIDNDSVVTIDLLSDVTIALPGATTSYTSTSDTGRLSVSWQVPYGAGGNYTFAVEAIDNVCPIPGVTSNSYTVIVSPSTYAGNDTTICLGDTAQLLAQGGSTFTWSVLSGEAIDTVSSSIGFNASCSDCATPSFSPSITTTYIVTSNVSVFCNATDTVTVNVTDLGVTLPDTTQYCIGDTVTVSANSTGTGVNYLWSTGGTADSLLINVSNTYYVTATGAGGCQQQDSVYVIENALPVFTIGNDTAICDGVSFTDVISPSNTYVTYVWSDSSNSVNYTISDTSGLVWLEVTDTNSCKQRDSLEVIILANPTVNLGPDTTICNYDSIILSSINSPEYSFYWSTGGADTNWTQVDTAATITLTVIDTHLCQTSDTIVVSEFQDAPVTLGADSGYCPGDTAAVFAQPQFATYNWSNGATVDSILVMTNGVYSLTVTDTNSCVSVDTVTISQYNAPTVDLGGDIIHCIGTPVSVLKDLGPLWVSYLWHDGSTLQAYNVTELDDTVWVEVQDTNGCFASDTLVVLHVSPPPVDLGVDTAYCSGESHVLRATPGMANYSWSIPNGGADTLNVLMADTYSVTISDTNGCIAEDTIVIAFDTLPQPNLGADFNKCVEDTVTVDAGAGYVDYDWNNGDTTQVINVYMANSYLITVTDSNGCEGSTGITIGNDSVPQVSIGPDNSICDGDSLMLDAGSGYSSYLWSNGSVQQTAVYDSAQSPWVLITDGNGCEGSDTMTLSILTLPMVDLGADQSICDGDTTVFDAGPNMVDYAWNSGDTTQAINVTVAGAYQVTVTDTNLCQSSDTANLVVNANPQPVLPTDIENCTGTAFNQLVDAGAGYNLYTWMDGTFTQIRNATQNDTVIWVEVTDSNSCVGSDTMYVIHLPLPSINIGPDDSICASQGYSLNAGNGGGLIASYLWTTGATTQSISIPSNPGIPADINTVYAVTVTDTLGCDNSDNMNLYSYALPNPVLPADTNFCAGDPFAMTISPGTFNSYIWSTGAITAAINIGAVPNTYSVTVTDGNGCANDTDMTVTEFAIPQPNLGPDEAFCEGSNYSRVLNPGNFSTYLWHDGSKGKVFGVTSAGTYSVTVTNTSGCTNSDDVIIIENPAPLVDLGADQFFCEDAAVSAVLDATTLLPGGGYSFLWSNGATTGTILVNNFGNYTVTVTNQATSCSAESAAQVIPFPKAQPDLGDDGQICEGQIITLDPNVSIPGYNYTWSTGATTPTISVFETGTYWVMLNADNGSCLGITDTIKFTIGVIPVVELGEDQYACEGQVVTLLNNSTPFPGANYVWEDGSEQLERQVTETGNYEIAVTNSCGTVYDQVYVEFQDCFGMYIPNAFTPNGDGVNDMFIPESDQEFREYGLWIYDRWGKLVFKTSQPGHGWDGKVNGEPALVGKYTWRISYVSAFQTYGERIEKVGEVNLLK